MLCNVFFVNRCGEVMIDLTCGSTVISQHTLPFFWGTPMTFPSGGDVIRSHEDFFSTFIKRSDVYVVAVVKGEALIAGVLGILQLLVDTIESFLKGFTEGVLRDNFSTVYQILQEVLDFGHPLHTHVHEIEQVVPKPTLENRVRQMLDSQPSSRGKANQLSGLSPLRSRYPNEYSRPATITDPAPWRSSHVTHASSELLFDIVEYIDCLMTRDGRVSHLSIRGAIEVFSKLNGRNPEVLVRLYHPEAMLNLGLHYCVRAGRYETDRSFSFIPPDGRFTLCQFTIAPPTPSSALSTSAEYASPIPFYVTPQVVMQSSEGTGRFSCMVGWVGGGPPLHGPSEVLLHSVELLLPENTTAIQVEGCSHGTTQALLHSHVVRWQFASRMSLGKSPLSLSGTFSVDHTPGGQPEVSAQVEFTIPGVTLGNVGIQSVLVDGMSKFFKGVKSKSSSGRFIVRSS